MAEVKVAKISQILPLYGDEGWEAVSMAVIDYGSTDSGSAGNWNLSVVTQWSALGMDFLFKRRKP